MFKILLAYLSTISIAIASEPTVFTFINKNLNDDVRLAFTHKVLTLALDKTVNDYGPYKVIPSKTGLTSGRLYLQLKSRTDNFFYKVSITDEFLERFHAIPFPIERGVVSFRIGIVHKDNIDTLKNVFNLEGLKKHLIIQGQGWLDNDIFKYNDLSSFSVATKHQCLELIARKRADVYFRGINEVSFEIQRRQNAMDPLDISTEPYVALHYPMPKFFITAKSNIKNAKRVEEGLKRAYEDGSFIALWEQNNLEAIKSQHLDERTIIELENPYITKLNDDYKKYNYTTTNRTGENTHDK